MKKKLLCFISCYFLVLTISCDLPVERGVLSGNWIISTVMATGDDLGNGNLSLNYESTDTSGLNTVVSYTGSGTIDGTAYDFYVTHTEEIDDIYLSLYNVGADISTSPDWIGFDNTTIGPPIAGDYTGSGVFAADTGTFTMSRP